MKLKMEERIYKKLVLIDVFNTALELTVHYGVQIWLSYQKLPLCLSVKGRQSHGNTEFRLA